MPGVEGPASVFEIESQPSAARTWSERKRSLEMVGRGAREQLCRREPVARGRPGRPGERPSAPRPSQPRAPGAVRSNHGPSSFAISISSARKPAKAAPSRRSKRASSGRSRRSSSCSVSMAPSRKTFSVGAASSTSSPRARRREVAPDRGPQEAEHVGARRGPEAGRELLRRARAADDLPPLDHHGPQPGPGEVRRGDEPVVAGADDDDVEAAAGEASRRQPSARPRTAARARARRARSRSPARPGCRRRPQAPGPGDRADREHRAALGTADEDHVGAQLAARRPGRRRRRRARRRPSAPAPRPAPPASAASRARGSCASTSYPAAPPSTDAGRADRLTGAESARRRSRPRGPRSAARPYAAAAPVPKPQSPTPSVRCSGRPRRRQSPP